MSGWNANHTNLDTITVITTTCGPDDIFESDGPDDVLMIYEDD